MLDFDTLYDDYVAALEQLMQNTGAQLCESMRKHYDSYNHPYESPSRDLYNSIHSETVNENGLITTYVYADAKNDYDGSQYAEFLEHGTGMAHTGHGRSGFWWYKDKGGEWHRTDGMDAKPFINPAVEEVMGDIKELFDEILVDTKKYRGRKG